MLCSALLLRACAPAIDDKLCPYHLSPRAVATSQRISLTEAKPTGARTHASAPSVLPSALLRLLSALTRTRCSAGDGSAYDALLSSLRRGGGVAAEALERRRRQETGESSDDGDGGSGSASDASEDEDEASQSDEEGGSGSGESSLSGSGAEESDPDADAADDAADAAASASDGDAPMVYVRPAGKAGADEPDEEPAAGDAFSTRLEAVLSDADVAALRARQAARIAWRAAGASPAAPEAVWELDGDAALPAERASPAAYPLPQALLRRWVASGAGDATAAAAAVTEPVDAAAATWASPAQRNLFALLDSYRDVLYTARQLPPRPDAPPAECADEVMDAVLLHALSHVLKTRSRILHNSERLRKRALAAGLPASQAGLHSDVPQDQGFTRPKVLLLLPLRSSAKRWLDRALALLPAAHGAADAVSKRERFDIEYGPRGDEAGANPRSLRGKPDDFKALFAGNRDDHFRCGLKLTRKSVRLFADFAGADIIIASPLGLATRLEAGDASFLSSIELLVADACDVMLMQNWAHVASVFGALNAMPSAAAPECEIMRVRPWYLNGHAAHYRQTVLLSAHGAPPLAALLRESCANAAGRARLRAPCAGALSAVTARATQEFSRVIARTAPDAADARFAAFRTRVWPRLRESRGGELLFVPSYFDFVRLRNFLAAEGASFVPNSEYADASEVGRARADFFAGDVRIMLYSERAHFFRRQTIRGARRVTFYAPPECASFYPEIVNALERGAEPNDVALLFSRWDAPALERLVGTSRSQRMLRDAAPAFIFC